jgi:integrase
MPAGACVIRYQGARGVTWKVKYRDASGRQVKEALGAESEGWNRKRARAELRERLVRVERDGYRRPEPTTFAAFARRWPDEYSDRRQHRRTTRHDYRGLVENHLIPHFGSKKLAEVTTRDVDGYVAAKRRAGLAALTINLHLTRLRSIFDEARRQGLLTLNPVSDAERPRVPKARWTILVPAEIAAVMRAFDELVAEAVSDEDRAWRQTAKAMAVTMQYAWLRRGELLGLRWRDIDLSHPDGPRLHVRETWVRGHRSQPKTDDGNRTVALAAPLGEELWQHRRRSRFTGDNALVFCHPSRGSAVSGGYFGAVTKLALARAGVERPMREFHDWRHTGITNAAASGMSPLTIMTMAGHADFKTTQRYIDLAGVVFGEQVGLLSDWYAAAGTKSRYQAPAAEEEARIVSGISASGD